MNWWTRKIRFFYYLTKAHEKFVSYGHGDPRCWHNALVNNLREDLKNNDARFENYVKENNYFNLEGFEQIMKDAHEQAMIEQWKKSILPRLPYHGYGGAIW